MVLLHGYGMSASVYRSVGDALSTNHRVIIPDLPGFGKSDKVGKASFEEFAALLQGFLREIGVSTATLIAHSMGGGVAIEFARLFPEEVAKLVLVDSVGSPIKRSTLGWAYSAIRKTWHGLYRLRVSLEIVSAFVLNCLRRPVWMLRTFRMTADCDLLGVLGRLKVRIRVVWAAEDEYFPLSACSNICRASSVKSILIDAGHDWIILEPTAPLVLHQLL
ncbi:MAG: alpha/beta hydrolase [Candidatus Woykebacteria bacterium]